MVHRSLTLLLFGALGLAAFEGFAQRHAAAGGRSATTVATNAPVKATVMHGASPLPPAVNRTEAPLR